VETVEKPGESDVTTCSHLDGRADVLHKGWSALESSS
jgi:hypothetical protein